MKAVIQAGGQGTRLRPVTYEIPKPLLPVKKRPIINYLVDLFVKHGADDIAIVVNRGHADDFYRWQKAWSDELDGKQITIFYEEAPRGTFGGMELLQEWIGQAPFIFSNADELKDFDLTALKNFHETRGGDATIALVEVPNAHEYGVPVLEGDRIREFLEKPQNPPSSFINSGLYVLHPAVFAYADFKKENLMIEKDIFPVLAKAGRLYGMRMAGGRWYDCGNIERWERAIKEW